MRAKLAAMLVLLPLATAAGAQVLSDPTRPPAGVAAGEGELTAGSGAPVLQSVMISATGRTAIISGEVVPLNGKFGTAQVVRISESEVVLKDGGEEQVLKLYPGVQKTGADANKGSRAGDTGRSSGTAPPAAGRR